MKNKKIKIHVKNNHWAPGSFPSDKEGEKVFTITNAHFEKALDKFPKIKKKLKSLLIGMKIISNHQCLIQIFYLPGIFLLPI